MDKKIWRKVIRNKVVRITGAISAALLFLFIVVTAVKSISHIPEVKKAGNLETQSTISMTMSTESVSAEEAAVSSAAEAPVVPAGMGEIQITISAAGDCTLAKDDGMDYDISFNAAYDEHGPEWFMDNVHDVFATDDLTIVNLECSLADSGSRDPDRYYGFRGDPEYVKVLTSGSVEACDIANNHSFDYGTEAYEETKKVLESAGITSFGYDRSQVVTVKGIKIGLVGIYELEAELGCKDLLLQEIENVQAQGAQLVIVSFHWGDEGVYDLTDIQIELAHAAIDAGANLILGHHPHRIQGVGHYNGVYIAYSLGNFVFGGNSDPADQDCMIFRQTFTFQDGVLQDTDEHLVIPCRISSTTEYNNYQPMILEGEEAEAFQEKLDSLL